MVVPRRPRAGPGESWKELYRHCRGGCHQGTLVPAEKQPKTVLDGGECLWSQLPESSLRGVAALALFRSESGICKQMVVVVHSPGKDLG